MSHEEDDDFCNHPRAGIVTNQPNGYDRNRAHASIAICGQPECRAKALAWVWKTTKEQGHYISDSSRGKS